MHLNQLNSLQLSQLLDDDQTQSQSAYVKDYQSLIKSQTSKVQTHAQCVSLPFTRQTITSLSQPNYRTSITQLIAQPIGQNYYSMQYVYQSIYQLSDYLWNKKIMAQYNKKEIASRIQTENAFNQMSFDEYLLPLQEELTKYDRFKKNKNKQQDQLYKLIGFESQQGNQIINPVKPALTLQNIFAKQHQFNVPSLQNQLMKCYQQVPFIFFQQNFQLDFSNFYDKQNRLKYNNTQKMTEQQQKMNDNLDLIEINLFGQIHRKFEDYFKAAANFDYLKQSIFIQLTKLKQARGRVSRVQIQFVEKSSRLRKKIIQRNNYQKLIKRLRILKSLKKLPSIVQQIMQSSLPYECLQLLKTTKKSISQVQSLKCVESILRNIKSSETIVQLGLNKRYTDQLYLYIEEAFSSVNLEQQFKKAASEWPVIDKDQNNVSSAASNISRRSELSHTNNENTFRAGDRSGFFLLDQLCQGKGTSSFNGKPLLKNSYVKRQQGKQYQIAMILLQSYEYVDFPVDVTKIKISNGLRVTCRKFQKQLINHIKKQLQKHASTNKENESNLLSDLQVQDQQKTEPKPLALANQQKSAQQQQDSPSKVSQYIDRVSIQFYIRHIKILNQLFKQSVNRYLGYILTLVTQYEEKLSKEIAQIDKTQLIKRSSNKTSQQRQNNQRQIRSESESNLDQLSLSKVKSLQKCEKMSRMQTSHVRFKGILIEQLSVLPSIFKIIEEKIKHFLTLKNISNVSPQQFFQWISLVRFWQRWFDVFLQNSILINYTCTYLTSTGEVPSSQTQLLSLGQNMIEQLITTIVDTTKKSIITMNLKNLITDLTMSYLNSYADMLKAQMYQGVTDQSWQSVQIPQQFSDVLNGIITKASDNQNMSLTILNSSTSKLSSCNKSVLQIIKSQSCLNNSYLTSQDKQLKYKILKNNILVQGQRYKLTVSFLLLCQFIQELIRVGRLFQGITGQDDSQQSIRESRYIRKILSEVYDKIYGLIDYYNVATKQMILQKKALKMERIKGNNITVKHICLLSNCLTFLHKLTVHIPIGHISQILNKKQRQSETLYSLDNHNVLLIDKISSILHKKMEQTLNNLKTKEQQKSFSPVSFLQFVVQSNNSIVTLFLQITQIVDEYLDIQKCEKILKLPFQLFVHKYFKAIIVKGEKFVQQSRILLQKMKFLKKYFKSEFTAMQRQIQE